MRHKKKRKAKVATSSPFKKGQEPITVKKTIRKKIQVDFVLNETFKEDSEKFNELFKSKFPEYFKKLRNELKNKNRVNEIFKYAEMYTKGGYLIKDIDGLQYYIETINVVNTSAKIAKK